MSDVPELSDTSVEPALQTLVSVLVDIARDSLARQQATETGGNGAQCEPISDDTESD